MICHVRTIGTPVAKGSTRSLVRGGRIVTFSTAGHKLATWERAIARGAALARPKDWDLARPMCVDLSFVLPRPHRRPMTRPCADSKPDVDKLARAALDALTGTLWRDDAQVTYLVARKRYARPGEAPGLWLWVSPDRCYTAATKESHR